MSDGKWIRVGRLVYALQHAGYRRGVEQFENRFSASVQPGRGVSEAEAERVAALMHAAPELLEALRGFIGTGTGLAGWLPGVGNVVSRCVTEDEWNKWRALLARLTPAEVTP